MKTAGLLGVDLEALQRVAADLLRVLDPCLRSLAQRIFPQRAREMEVPFGVGRIGRDGAPRVELAGPVIEATLLVIALI